MRSFLPIPEQHPFPIQNLPYGIFSTPEKEPRVGVAIGDFVLDLAELEAANLLPGSDARSSSETSEVRCSRSGVFARRDLNAFIAQGEDNWREVRAALLYLLDEQTLALRSNDQLRRRALIPAQEVRLHLPVSIGDYTDFYSSKSHAANVGRIFRGENTALLPNWVYLPVAYHGRASSIVLSGTAIRRPCGQIKRATEAEPHFEASRELDFELEVGYFIGAENSLGVPVPIKGADQHLFGMVLVNDWSARDIQRWEYVPLGPFSAKNFGTSISPWVVTLAALGPFRTTAPVQDPAPLSYLRSDARTAYDIRLEVQLQTASMPAPAVVSRTNFKELYWTIGQQVAHHTVTGCNLRIGDLLASGTISGPGPAAYGSMLELTSGGKEPLRLPNGEKRCFLEDGDTVIFTGYAQGDNYRVGFGEVRGTILPAYTGG
ncbi:MAG: fumarylacetoacetase [Verrucomicrobia bacterium]|nr:fumarylacetoacetase [Verrucomicrobiota bacterium]MBV9276468.1 fumarylacetoacetase [Verrucomicrobiota bacterium]